MYPKPFEYTRATSVEHALKTLKENEGSRVIAGGQSLLPMLKARIYQPVMLVDINFIPELRKVELNDKGELVIGAMVTHFDVIENSLIRENAPILSVTASHIGDVQIRNRGTIGGSVCEADPSADYLPTLFALDARAVVKSTEGSREVPIQELIQGPFEAAIEEGEMLSQLIIPANRSEFRVEKYARRKADFAISSIAAIADVKAGKINWIRLATGAMQDGPHRLTELEGQLNGKNVSDVDLDKLVGPATEALEPIEDLHGGPEYRLYVLKGMISRVVRELLEGEGA